MSSKLQSITNNSPITTMPTFDGDDNTPRPVLVGETSNPTPDTRTVITAPRNDKEMTREEVEEEYLLKYRQFKEFLATYERRCSREKSPTRRGDRPTKDTVKSKTNFNQKRLIEIEE